MKSSRPAWARYLLAVLAILAATAVRMLLDEWLGEAHAFTQYYAAVALVAWYSGPLPAVGTLVAGMILGDWFFMEPRHSLGLVNFDEWVSYCAFILTASVIIVFSRLSHLAYQKESLCEIQALNRELADADRRKDDFLAMLGHELRNPLASILNGVEVLKMLDLEKPDTEQMREVIERETKHMAHLVDDLLDVSRISRGKIRLRRQRCELVGLIQRAAESHRSQVDEAGLRLNLFLPQKVLWTVGDPTRISQVVSNLLSNAVKFTSVGGQITLKVTEEPEDRSATVVVQDTGIGMEPSILSRVFEPFTQAEESLDRSRGGLGLGLALVKGIVELHGGEVSAHSDGVGRGAEFRVRLPLDVDDLPESPPDLPRPLPCRSCRVLLVDDRRDAILPMRRMLELLGQKVAVAADGTSALQKAKDIEPDIVLCDIGLPDMTGYAVAQSLRAESGLDSAYLVAVTGYGQDEDRHRAKQAGFDYHLTKPVTKEQLESLLAERPRFS